MVTQCQTKYVCERTMSSGSSWVKVKRLTSELLDLCNMPTKHSQTDEFMKYHAPGLTIQGHRIKVTKTNFEHYAL